MLILRISHNRFIIAGENGAAKVSSRKQRRLAAIMFTDVVGHTLSKESAVSLAPRSSLCLRRPANSGKKNTRPIAGTIEEAVRPIVLVALLHMSMGNKDEAFAHLERAYHERSSWLVWANVEPRFDPLRSDPRFASILTPMRLQDRNGTASGKYSAHAP
jgi:hypothetical protein